MKLHASLAVLLVSASAASTHAATITLFGTGTRASALAAETAYLSSLGGMTVVTEDFESGAFTANTRSASYLTAVGTFTGVTAGNTGIGGSCEPFCTDGLAIYSRTTTPFSGRFAIEDDGSASGASKKWLDSNDFKLVTWTPSGGPFATSIGFFLTDLSDVGALFHMNVTDGLGGVTASGTLKSGLASGTYFYAVIADADGIAGMDFFSNAGTGANDGYGIDRFTTATPTAVPEPGSLLLLGSGLVALARRRSRR